MRQLPRFSKYMQTNMAGFDEPSLESLPNPKPVLEHGFSLNTNSAVSGFHDDDQTSSDLVIKQLKCSLKVHNCPAKKF